VSRIYSEVQDRPKYIVRDRINFDEAKKWTNIWKLQLMRHIQTDRDECLKLFDCYSNLENKTNYWFFLNLLKEKVQVDCTFLF
jgi:hypothetical protein